MFLLELKLHRLFFVDEVKGDWLGIDNQPTYFLEEGVWATCCNGAE